MRTEDLIKNISKLVPEVYENKFKKDWTFYSQVRSCISSIASSHLAIEYYRSKDYLSIAPKLHANELDPTTGEIFLTFVGLMQCLVIQQDAVNKLAEILECNDINIYSYDALKEIRDLRNKTIGHPVEQSYDKVNFTFNSIELMVYKREGNTTTTSKHFDLFVPRPELRFTSLSPSGKGITQNIHPDYYIFEQRKYMDEILSQLVKKLEEQKNGKNISN